MTEGRKVRLSEDGKLIIITVPLQFKRRKGRKQIIAPPGVGAVDGQTGDGDVNRNESLALMIARAHHWRDLLESGKFPTVRALAKAARVDSSYLNRMLRLTFLAPDIIEAILEGREPSGLTLRQLLNAPTGWGAQRTELGV